MQALLRRMKKLRQQSIDYNLIRILSTLAFLPADLIPSTYDDVKRKYGRGNKNFFEYFDKVWMTRVR